MKKILIINGPNLNLLGVRDREVYGSRTFEDYLTELVAEFEGLAELDYVQSNVEGVLIDAIHGAREIYDGVVLNAGGYTHTSVALADA
ncbi:type II 3-dehydroquinate dehydratase, partial [uncultured Rikenella sp.]